jgi:hypothetical protein
MERFMSSGKIGGSAIVYDSSLHGSSDASSAAKTKKTAAPIVVPSPDAPNQDFTSFYIYGPQLVPSSAAVMTQETMYGMYTGSQRAGEFISTFIPEVQRQIALGLDSIDPNHPNDSALLYVMGRLGLKGADTDTNVMQQIERNLQDFRDHMIDVQAAQAKVARQKMEKAMDTAKKYGKFAEMFGDLAMISSAFAMAAPGIGTAIGGAMYGVFQLTSVILNKQIVDAELEAKAAQALNKFVGAKIKELDGDKEDMQAYFKRVMEFKTDMVEMLTQFQQNLNDSIDQTTKLR